MAIAGANESVFNDSFTILTVPATNQFTFAVTTGDGSATGTITCKIAPLGWTKPYTGTNKAVYRAPSGNRFYLRVDDSNAQYMAVTAYETMSDVDTGTGAVGPVYWKKSSTSDTTARPWLLIGDTKRFYLVNAWHASYTTGYTFFAFGDFTSYRPSDAYNTMLIGHSASAPSYPYSNIASHYTYYGNASAYIEGQYVMRSWTGGIGGVQFWKASLGSCMTTTGMGYNTSFAFANPADNGLHLYPVEIAESTFALRGRVPGLYSPLESVSGAFNTNDRTVVINGKTYCAVKLMLTAGPTYGNCWFSISDAW